MATTTGPSASKSRAPAPPFEDLPPLENGDRLTRAEFERRYEAMPYLKKAELIEGVVYIPFSPSPTVLEGGSFMSSPVSFAGHSTPHFDLIGWLYLYRAQTPGVRGGDNATLRLDLDNMPQPDVFLLVLPGFGGQARISADDYVQGAPELIAEVASSSVSYDLHNKLEVYRRNGVREYVVWRVRDRAIDWFASREGRFEPLPLGADGLYRSEVFPGLHLDPAALINGDTGAVMRTLMAGLATPEHAAFVARLHEAAGRAPEPNRGP